MWTRWLLLLHVVSVITFFLAHGAGAALSFKIRRETVPERMRAMLDLSGSGLMLYMVSYLLMGITGITQLVGLKLWASGWV